jgi:[citrate (pro-3S)-lyase] ligase
MVFRIDSGFELGQARQLLALVGLKVPPAVDDAVGIYDGGRLVGSGALAGHTLQGIAVAPDYQGEGVSNIIVTHLLKRAVELGRGDYIFIFTKPREAEHFQRMDFKLVAVAAPFAVLLEWGSAGIGPFKQHLRQQAQGKPEGAACVVLNGNPFTLGHRYLIEQASREKPWVYVLVVEEDKSLFSFPVRIDLITKGVADLPNVTVLPGGKYIISELIFPSYFTRDEELAEAQASLDLTIFGEQLAPCLRIGSRYVGEEPYSRVTAKYNHCMQKILPVYGIEVKEVPRLQHRGEFISASRVRELIGAGRLAETEALLPAVTFNYLRSPEAAAMTAIAGASSSSSVNTVSEEGE